MHPRAVCIVLECGLEIVVGFAYGCIGQTGSFADKGNNIHLRAQSIISKDYNNLLQDIHETRLHPVLARNASRNVLPFVARGSPNLNPVAQAYKGGDNIAI